MAITDHMRAISRSQEILKVSHDIMMSWLRRLSERQRHYHTLDHISALLGHYRDIEMEAPIDNAVMHAAIWLHDIVYDPTRPDNEEQSAEVAKADLIDSVFQKDFDGCGVVDVVDVILATKKHEGESMYNLLFNDLDMSIIGANPQAYMQYATDIRREFMHVPLALYAEKRAEILEAFNEKVIFRTPYFTDREEQAHANLKREIKFLREYPDALEMMAWS